jgi:AcrR family transcriptional regulator
MTCGGAPIAPLDSCWDVAVPRLIDSYTRTGAMVLAINHILVTQGFFGLTLRTIARESGISTGSLLHHFGHRERVLGVAAYQTGRSLLSEIGSGVVRHGVEAFLPMDDEGVLLTRAWLSWCELWRSEDWLTETVGDLRAQERGMLAEAHDFQVVRADLDLLVALVDGLRVAVCAPVRPMPPAGARALLAAASATALERSAWRGPSQLPVDV